MIKKIHYCWFGRSPLPKSALKCIESWKKFCPDWEIIQWNEDNFNINKTKYSRFAYENKKYAYVSDVCRYEVLYNEGGLYLDTDVEILKDISPLCDTPFLGFERPTEVAPGLIMYANPGMNLYKQAIDFYANIDPQNFDFDYNIVRLTTDLLVQRGLKQDNSLQVVDGITIYPMEYFNPRGEFYGKAVITPNTYSIHNYDASWKTPLEKKLQIYRQKFGYKIGTILFTIFHPIYALNKHKINKTKENNK